MILANIWSSTLHSQGKGKGNFPPAARRMDTLNDLLAASDLISLHCALTNETMQIINAECLQHVKPGMYLFICWRFSIESVSYYGLKLNSLHEFIVFPMF